MGSLFVGLLTRASEEQTLPVGCLILSGILHCERDSRPPVHLRPFFFLTLSKRARERGTALAMRGGFPDNAIAGITGQA